MFCQLRIYLNRNERLSYIISPINMQHLQADQHSYHEQMYKIQNIMKSLLSNGLIYIRIYSSIDAEI